MKETLNTDALGIKVRIEDVTEFADFLSSARKTIQKTQKQIASEVGIKESTISNWEKTMISSPPEDILPAMAQAYGVDLETLRAKLAIHKEARALEKASRRPPPKAPIWRE